MGDWDPIDAFKQTVAFILAGKPELCAIAPDCESMDSFLGPHGGWDAGQRAEIQAYYGAFSDLKINYTNALAAGTQCAIELQYEMTHTGPLVLPDRTIPATGQRVTMRASVFATFDRIGKGALMQRFASYYDPTEMLSQIGADRAPRSRVALLI